MAAGRWHILGGGSLGSLWSARLARAGVSTTIILRDEAWSLMGRPPTSTVCVEEQYNPTPRSWLAEACVEAASGENPIERLLVATKAPDVSPALERVIGRLTSKAVVVVLGNGMGVYDELMSNRRLAGFSYLLATTTHGVFTTARLKCVHSGFGETWVGVPPGSTLSVEDARATVASLQQTDLSVTLEGNIENVLWNKLAVNASINGLTAIMGCRNGAILESDHGLSLVKDLCAEVGLVMEASEIPVPGDLLTRVLNVVHLNAKNFSSMHQDMAYGRATEVDYLNGFVVKKANKLGVSTPTNRVVYDLIKMKELIRK